MKVFIEADAPAGRVPGPRRGRGCGALGRVELTLEQVRRIETALGLAHGTIAIVSGYVDDRLLRPDALDPCQ
jgi:hypothetical protein